MGGAFAIIVYVLIILAVINKVSKKNKTNRNNGQFLAGNENNTSGTVNTHSVNNIDYPVKRNVPVSGIQKAYKAEKSTHTLMEDRNNDWLARQFREERRALHMASNMFNYQMERKSSCDARMLKEFHSANCSAGGVDNPGH